MKLLFCRACGDLFKLLGEERKCRCGKSRGQYVDEKRIVYSGADAMPLGIDNGSMETLARMREYDAKGRCGPWPSLTLFRLPANGTNTRREPEPANARASGEPT